MHIVIASKIGRIHHAIQHPSLAKVRPVYAFIPEEHFAESGFQKNRYLVSRWPAINCGANRYALGSHVIPDPENPVCIRSRCPVLDDFIKRLELIASIKNTQPAA